MNNILSVEAFENAIRSKLQMADSRGEPFLEILSGTLHREIGGYPGHDHRMPNCCQAMKNLMKQGDKIVAGPPKGKGASLKIRYVFPREQV